VARSKDEMYSTFNSIDEAREDAQAIIEQLGGEAYVIKFEVIEQLRDEGGD
jgi:vacuolar-type H+-ATPase subunit H